MLTLAIVCVLALGFFAIVGRPLLFASLDEPVARAGGVPVRALSLAFMLALGLTVAATAQITGALLVFALLVAPAATAQLITPRIGASLVLTVLLGVLITWLGLALAYFYNYPVGFYITAVAFSVYADRPARSRCDRSSHPAPRPLPGRRGAGVMFAQEFVRNAWLAGTAIALASGLIGYFVVLRAQVFAGDALSHVAFTGALAAAAAGIDIRIGLFAATILIALLLGSLGDRSHADDVTIGIIFAAILGLGVYFLALFSTGSGGGNGLLGARTLFGSIFGLSATDAMIAALIAAGIIAVVLAIARPLLFASIDPAVAAARGVPVRALGLLLLVLLGATTAEATQAIGALLLLGLLAAPAGAAQRLTANPYHALGLSAAIAVLSTWAGLTLSYVIPKLPPSSAIIAVATGIYLLAFLATSDLRHARRRGRLTVIRGTEN